MRKELEQKIRKLVTEELKEIEDYIRIDITYNKGLMIMVEKWDKYVGLEYFIELSDIVYSDSDCWYDLGSEHNRFCEFGNIDKLIDIIDEYLKDNNIDVCSNKWDVWWNRFNMKFIAQDGTEVIFDDWCDETEDEELGGYWVGICNECLNKYNVFGNRIDECGSGCCSVKGCRNEADHYVDFSRDEVVFE